MHQTSFPRPEAPPRLLRLRAGIASALLSAFGLKLLSVNSEANLPAADAERWNRAIERAWASLPDSSESPPSQ